MRCWICIVKCLILLSFLLPFTSKADEVKAEIAVHVTILSNSITTPPLRVDTNLAQCDELSQQCYMTIGCTNNNCYEVITYVY